MNTNTRHKQWGIPFLLILFTLFFCWLFCGRYGVFGSKVDWISQHSVFPDYFRQQFYDTGDFFPEFAAGIGGGQNIYNFAYYGLYSPVFLLSYLLPFVKMSDYLIAASFTCLASAVVLLYFWLIKREFSQTVSFLTALLFLLSAPMIFQSYNQIMFVNYMPFLCMALWGVDSFLEKGKPLLSSGLGVDIKDVDCSLYECIIDHADVRDAIYTTDINGLDIIPSHIDLVGAEIEMLNLDNRERVLKNLLAPISSEYDYILIDCSPSLGLITVNALTAANSVIIPVQCEYFALEGISKLLNTIKIIKSKLNQQLEIEGFLLTMYDSRLRLANQIYDEVKRHFQELVFKTVIQRNVKLSESPSHGLPVILYDADSTGAKNHLALAKELINRNA